MTITCGVVVALVLGGILGWLVGAVRTNRRWVQHCQFECLELARRLRATPTQK